MAYSPTATREFATGGPLTLEIDSRQGQVAIAGGETDRVSLEVSANIWARSEREADDIFQRIVAGIRQEGDTLSIEAPDLAGLASSRFGPFVFGRGISVDYRMHVPKATRCTISSRGGGVEVSGVAGPVEVRQRSGRTSVRGIAGDVRVESSSGRTDVEDVGGDVQVEVRSGAVHAARVDGDVMLRCQSGKVVAEELHGHTDIESSSGSISLTGAEQGARVQARSGSARYTGAVLGDLDVQTGSGSILLAVDPRHPFLIDAETRSGSVRSDLAPHDAAEPPPPDAPTVRLRAASGSIRIARM
jgi:hypothetical protein